MKKLRELKVGDYFFFASSMDMLSGGTISVFRLVAGTVFGETVLGTLNPAAGTVRAVSKEDLESEVVVTTGI